MAKRPPLESQRGIHKGVMGSLLLETCIKMTEVGLNITDIMDLK